MNDSIFVVTSKVSHEVPLTKEGDTIKIGYDKEQKGLIELIEFDNISINQAKAEESKPEK